MKKYTQDSTMNCLQCCLAGVFGLPLGSVPTVHKWSKENSYWFDGLVEWVRTQGYETVSIVDDTLDGLYHIAVIRESGKSAHAVVCKGTNVIWDPAPTNKITNLLDEGEWEYSLLFVKVVGKCLQSRLEQELTNEG